MTTADRILQAYPQVDLPKGTDPYLLLEVLRVAGLEHPYQILESTLNRQRRTWREKPAGDITSDLMLLGWPRMKILELSRLLTPHSTVLYYDDHVVGVGEHASDQTLGEQWRFYRDVPFLATMHEELVAWTDGSGTFSSRPCGAGYVVCDMKGELVIEAPVPLGNGTSNVAELSAILYALRASPWRRTSWTVCSDSAYAIGMASQLSWKANANTSLVEELREEVAWRRVAFTHVPGHKGIPGNERADFLAAVGAAGYSSLQDAEDFLLLKGWFRRSDDSWSKDGRSGFMKMRNALKLAQLT